MKKSYIVIAMAALMLAVSCRRSENELPEGISQSLTVSVESSDFESSHAEADSVVAMFQRAFAPQNATPDGDSPSTKAVETAFDANDSIGLYIHTTTTLGSTGIHTRNLCYATPDGTAWTGEDYLTDVLKTGTTYYATSYYPFIRRIDNPTMIAHTVAADQSTYDALTASDLMYSAPATVAGTSTAPKITLSFKHLLSKVEAKFIIPKLLDGATVMGVNRVMLKSVNRAVNVNLADGSTASLNDKGDIKMCHTSGVPTFGKDITYAAILTPQTIAKGAKLIEIYFTTSAGEKTYRYTLEEDLVLTPNMKHALTLVSIGDLCFASTLDLTDGLAKSGLPLTIKAPSGEPWTLTSGAEWLTLSFSPTGPFTNSSLSATGTGIVQTVYVGVTANTAMVGQFWEPRTALLTIEAKGAKSYYTARQNFYRFELETTTRSVEAGQSVIGVEGFGANQVWSAASGADWVKLASSVVYGEGDPSASYGPVNGALESGTLFYQIAANNTNAPRTATVVFTPTTTGASGVAVTFEQAAGSVQVSTTKVTISGGAATGVDMFDLTVSQGVKWKILSAVGVATTPAVGAEQTGLGTPLTIKGTWLANNTTDILTGEVVIGYGAYGAEQKRTVIISQAPEFIVINGTRWATGNLVASGAQGARIGAPSDGGLYFQYGSLIGYKGGAKGDGTGTVTVIDGKYWDHATAFSAIDIAIIPNGYSSARDKWPYFDNAATGGYGYYYYSNITTKYADFQSQANGKDVAQGIGDPCAQYLGGNWRLPKYDELAAITGSAATEGNRVDWSDPSITGRWMRRSSTQIAEGAWFGPNSRSGNPNINTDLFIPASGHRHYASGTFSSTDIYAFLWSSSIGTSSSGIFLQLSESNGVYPCSWSNRSYGFPVRCVYEEPYNPQPPTADQYVEMNGLRWAKGNLVARGANNCEVGEPGDGGLYFQYGGLIGYKGGLNGDGRGAIDATKYSNSTYWGGTRIYSTNDVAVSPVGYANQAKWPSHTGISTGGFGYYYFNDFVTKYADFQGQTNGNNPANGIGDPCAYYLGDGWRLPKYNEFSTITGSTSEGTWVGWAGITGKFVAVGPKSAKGAWFGPNSKTGTPNANTDLFVPFTGLRNYTTGSFNSVPSAGYLWSSSIYSASSGFSMRLNESAGVLSQNWDSRNYGEPVRCVQEIQYSPQPTEAQTVEVAGLRWTTGNLVANGTNGARVGKPEDGGLYFQFGSLIGWKGGANGDGTGRPVKENDAYYVGSTFDAVNEVQVVPAQFTRISSIGSTWPAQKTNLYYFGYNVDPYDKNGTDIHSFTGFTSGALAVDGVGDPCRYYLGDTWRLPTSAETKAMIDAATKTYEGTWTNGTSTDSYLLCKFAGGAELRFPAAGQRRFTTGAFYRVGSGGYYWSSSTQSSGSGSNLYVLDGTTTPQAIYDRCFGMPIRCVQNIASSPTAPTEIEVNGVTWATGNLVANGSNGAKVGAPGDGGLYFQYGGLIGYKGGATGDGTGLLNATTHANGKWWNGAAAYSTNDVAIKPVAYTNQATWPSFNHLSTGGFGYYYYNTLVTKYADFQSQHNANQPELGIGDPCAYYLGSLWRLPTANELLAVTGSTVEGTWDPWTNTALSGRWMANGPQQSQGAWFGPNSRTGTPTVNTDIFIPMSGFRSDTKNGAFQTATQAFLLSSSADESTTNLSFVVHPTRGVVSSASASRPDAFPVRCVKDKPTKPTPPTADQYIEMHGLRWAKGNLVADGSHNAKVGEPGDYGLYFQYGGLVGYKGGANGDGTGLLNATTHANGAFWNGAATYSSNDIALTPTGYAHKGANYPDFTGVGSGGFGYYYFNSFVTRYADFQAQSNANDPTKGIGDPCAHYLGNGWRMPTISEISDVIGNSLEGNWLAWTAGNVLGQWSNAGPKSAKGAWFGPNAKGSPTVNTDLFLTASGQRSVVNKGGFNVANSGGYLWSSSAYNGTTGYFMGIQESAGVFSRYWTPRPNAFPVRCVQDIAQVKNPPAENQIILLNGLRWTKGNLIAVDGRNAKVGEPGDNGLYFQYGGLVGYKGGANGDGVGVIASSMVSSGTQWWNGATAYSSNDVAVAPTGYTRRTTWPYHNNNASGGFGYYYFNTFATKYADFQSQSNADQPELGIGDPCAYYLGSPWRLPTYTEIATLMGSSNEIDWVEWTDANVSGRWVNPGPKSSPGAWFGPNSKTGTPNANTDLFLTGSARRYSQTGVLISQNYAFVLSSSAGGRTNSFVGLARSGNGVLVPWATDRAEGLPVRCVSDDVVEVEGTKWAKGNLVAKGTNNAVIGARTDGGLYFQFGSLIGWKGGATGDGTGRPTKASGTFYSGTTFNAAGEVQIVPVPFTRIGSIGATWPKRSDNLYYFGLTSYGASGSNLHDYPGFSSGAMAADGVGDPCRYYLGSTWRLPTYAEFKKMSEAATKTANPGGWLIGRIDSYLVFTFSDGAELRFPAVGWRDRLSNGAMGDVGGYGHVWSSSVGYSTGGYHLNFFQNGFTVNNTSDRSLGLSVRCVKN